MNHPMPFSVLEVRTRLLSALLTAAILYSTVSVAATTTVTLPTTPVGKLSGELIHHMNTDNPAQIQQWASGVLSASIHQADRDDFIANLASAARDSGGVDLFDVRTDKHQPGLLEVVVKGRRSGQLALFFLTADPARPQKLTQADVGPMDDPTLYANWPQKPISHIEMARLIHATLDRLVRTTDFSGCVTVIDKAETVFDECRGLAERNFAVPIDHQTRFHIGSMDKMFTAVAIAQLVEAGELSWNATLAQLVPEYPDHEAAKKITVWQLLHHTAGLGDFFAPEYFQHREAFVNPADYLDLIARQPKMSEPGKQLNYSNAGYVLLGRIIENVSHEGYFDYIQRHVFTPADMHDSGFDRLDDVTPKLAVGYFREGVFSNDWKADWMKLGIKGSPAGGGYSTTTDLLRFASALREGKLVKPATLAKMFDDEVPAGPGAYAAGFGDRSSHGDHVRGHAGGIEGTTANLQMVWSANAAIALTSNEGFSQSWLLAEYIADLLAIEGAKH
jgi:D-alanyl-D-alanine carboxypeptidase